MEQSEGKTNQERTGKDMPNPGRMGVQRAAQGMTNITYRSFVQNFTTVYLILNTETISVRR